MNKLKEKLKKQGGFTLVEMLIVVAIIAILIAISIPMVNSSLEKAREAVDQSNARDAIGLAAVKVLSDTSVTDGTTWNYCVDANHVGTLQATTVTENQYKAQSTKYGKGSALTVTYNASGDGTFVAKYGEKAVSEIEKSTTSG